MSTLSNDHPDIFIKIIASIFWDCWQYNHRVKSLRVQCLAQKISPVFEMRWFSTLLEDVSNHQYCRWDDSKADWRIFQIISDWDEMIRRLIGGDFKPSLFEMRWFSGLSENFLNHQFLDEIVQRFIEEKSREDIISL